MVEVEALLFDVFGTVVDWRSCVARECAAAAARLGVKIDGLAMADAWRALYQPGMDAVRSGQRPWTILDVLHRESLDKILPSFGMAALAEAERADLAYAWRRLDPWADVVEGLRRLKSRYVIGTLSNGNVALLTRMAKHAGLPWDVVLGAESSRAYKPLPEAYLGAARLLDLPPTRVMLVAAHNGDLAAATKCGLRTGFVPRPAEHGLGKSKDLAPAGPWDVVATDFNDLAAKLGC
jgi:2-haloacid dehalogenase